VNRESRFETLKLYRVIHPDRRVTVSLNGAPQPLFLNPSTDVPYVKMYETIGHGPSVWLAPMVAQNPGCFDDCNVLEIRDFFWEPLAIAIDRYADVPFILEHFPALEEVRIRLFEYYSADIQGSRARRLPGGTQMKFTKQDRIDTENLFQAHFLEELRINPKYKAPKVSIYDWNKLQME
jgi:hypothetical protein